MLGSIRSPLSLRGVLRFVMLLGAACLVGALVGLLTEPLDPGRKSALADSSPPAGSSKTTAADSTSTSTSKAADPPSGAAADAPTSQNGANPGESPLAAGPESKLTGPDAFPAGPKAARAGLPGPDLDLRGIYAAVGTLLAFGVIAALLAKRGKTGRAGNGTVHLVDTLHVGNGRKVHLLRCEGRKYLIGNSERGLVFLASVPQNELERALDAEITAGPDETLDGPEGEPAFDRILAGSTRR